MTFEGKFFQVHNATSTIRPVQKPHPPIWIAANADRAVIRSRSAGLPLGGQSSRRPAHHSPADGSVQGALDEAGHPVPEDMPMLVEMHTAPTREEAIEIARPFLEAKYLAYADWGQDRVLPGAESFRISFDSLPRTVLFSAALRTIRGDRTAGPRSSAATISSSVSGGPGMEHEKVMRVIEMTGERSCRTSAANTKSP